MEGRFGRDLNAVRVHTGADAIASARAMHARAFASGHDIVFSPGAYAPQSAAGRQLLAHELAHTVQQAGGQAPFGAIQRQESSGPITARSVFPYEQGERVTVNHLLNDVMLGMIEGQSPDLAAALRAMVQRRATVTIATDDVFEARIEAESATDDTPAREAMVLRFARSGSEFSLEFFRIDDQGQRVQLNTLGGLTARRDGGAIRLAGRVGGFDLEFAVRPGEAEGQRTLAVVKPPLRLLDIRTLPRVQAGSSEERQAVERAARDTGGSRTWPRQRFRLEGGGLWLAHEPLAPLFGVGWQMSFIPSASIGPLLQVPVEVQIQYAPAETDFFARATSGVESSLSPLVPLNVRLALGVGGGTVHADPEATDPSRRVLLGPTFGGALGYEAGWFRMDMRYDYLLNLFDLTEGAHTLSLRAGGAF